MDIQKDGYVGYGTTNPQTIIHIVQSNVTIRLEDPRNDINSTANIEFKNGSADQNSDWKLSSSNSFFNIESVSNNSCNILSLNSNGNIIVAKDIIIGGNIVKSGENIDISKIHTSNITSGALLVERGGTGLNILQPNQLIVGNGINPPIQSPNLVWNNTTNTLTTSNINALTFSGIGSNITRINANNIETGTINTLRLPVATTNAIGAIKKGDNINIADDGTISVNLAYYNGNSTINGDFVVNSNLVVHGTSTTLNTDVYTTERLEVTNGGTTNSTLTIRQTVLGNTNNIFNVINSATSNVFNVSSVGNVGIGTTINTAGVLLDVNGTIESRNSIGANTSFYLKGVANSDINRVITAGQYSTNSAINDMVLRSTNKLVLQSGTTSPAIVIDTANKIGIGITNPSELLHVNGIIKTEGTIISGTDILSSNHIYTTSSTGRLGIGINPNMPTSSHIHLHRNSANTEIKLQFTDGTTLSTATDGLALYKGTDQNGYLWNYENKDLAFGTNSIERMRILANGFMGIFNNAPIAPLTIGNASLANNDGFIVLEKCTNIGTTRQFRIGLNSSFDFTIGDYGAGNVAGTWVESFKIGYSAPANSLIVNGSGNVDINNILKIGSIGGTTGTIKLQVYAAGSDGATCAIFKHPNDSQGIGIKFNEIYGTNANQDLKLSVSGTGILAFSTNSIERIRVTNNGNVGIGTNTGITEKLVVSGNAQITGTISGNGSLITNLNAGNITTGTLPVGRGGIGSTTLTATQILVGDGANPITSFSRLTWTNETNTLTATNITGAGSNITNINANNISSGTIDRLRLPLATSAGAVGAVKKGNNINIDEGTISVDLATYNGDSTINGNLVVNSNLIVHGTSTTLNTDVYTTERLEITNSGTINSTFTIRQTAIGNANNILNVINSETSNVFNVSSSGNVGIGTTNPINRLHLHNTAANSDVSIRFTDATSGAGAANGFAVGENTAQKAYLWNYGNTDMLFATNNAERMTISSNGNVGIGTTLNTAGVLLDVNGIIESRTSVGANNTFYFKGVANSDLSRVTIAGQYSTGSEVNDIILRSTNKLVLQSGVGAASIIIDTANNVGIGITNPQTTLDVNGNLLLRAFGTNNSGTKGIFFRPDFVTANLYNCSILTFDHNLNGSSDGISINANDGVSFCSGSNARNERMRITENGNVGIGTTNPNSYVDIVKTSGAGVSIDMLNMRFDNNWGIKFQQSYTGSGNIQYNLIHRYNTNDYNSLTFKGANVGIGTTNPQRQLHIHNNMRIGGSGPVIDFGDNMNVQIYRPFTNNELSFTTSGTDRLRITDNGIFIQQNVWHSDLTGNQRIYFSPNAQTYLRGHGTTPIEFRNATDTPIFKISSTGILDAYSHINIPSGSKYKINGQDLAFNNLIGIIPSSNLPIAGTGTIGILGGIKVDGSSITIDTNGIISASSASGSKWALLDSENIYKVSGNVGIGIDSNIDEKLLVNGNIKITNGSLLTSNIITSNIITSNITTNIVNAQTISGAGSNITNINANNISYGTINRLRLPLATSSDDVGAVKKGNNININEGTISVDLTTYNGDSTINGNLVVNSNLVVHGTSTTLNTDVYTTERLEVTNSGTTNSTLTIRQTATGNANNIFNVINSATSNVFNVSSAGNVGIGTTTNTNGVLLDVNGNIESRTSIGANNTIYFKNVANSDINRVIIAGSYSTNSEVNDMVIRSTNKLVLQSGTTDPSIVIGTTNNVGIGTTAPNYNLHVHKTATAQDVRIQLTDGTSTASGSRGFQIIKGSDNIAYVYHYENQPMIFGTNAAERMRILANGNINMSGTLTLPNDINAIYSGGGGRTYYINNGSSIYWGYGSGDIHQFRNSANNAVFNISASGTLTMGNNVWHKDLTGGERLYFSPNTQTYIKGYGTSPIEFRNGVDSTILKISSTGILDTYSHINIPSGSKYKINGQDLAFNNLIGIIPSSNLPIAGTGTIGNIGAVKVDGSSITVDTNGIISASSASGSKWALLGTDNIYKVSGNVGIGIDSNIDEKLIVNGNIKITNGSLLTSNIITSNITTNIVNAQTISGAGSNITNIKAGNITSGTIDSLRLPIATSGVLGAIKKGNNINIEPNGTISVDLLSYNGDSTINGNLVVNSNLVVHGTSTTLNTDVYTTERLEVTNSGTTNSTLTIRQTATGNANNIFNVINSATSNVFNVSSAGNVGIGTTAPNANLHLHSNAASQNVRISFTDNTSGVATTDGFCIGKDAVQVGYIYNTESNAISIGTNNIERIRIAANGAVGIQNNGYVIPNNFMTAGSLAIGNTNTNYGDGTGNNTNMAGLMLECLDTTEIAVHDSHYGFHSFMRYTTNGNFTIGRNMGWGTANVSMLGSLAVTGNVGIGKTASYKLDVNGDVNATDIRIGGISLNTTINTSATNTSNFVRTSSNILYNDYVARDTALNTALTTSINTSATNTSNFVRTSSNILYNDYVARDTALNTALTASINTSATNTSNFVRTSSNILYTDYVARDTALNTALTASINTSATNTSNFVRTSSNILYTDYVARNVVLDTKINTNNTNVSNYISVTSNFLKSEIDNNNVWTKNGTHIYKNNTGNIGIGITNPTTAKLVISGTAGNTGLDMATTDQYAEMRVIRNSLSSFDKDLYLNFAAGANSKTKIYSNNVETMLLSGGNVGIGTSVVTHKLTILGTAGCQLMITSSNASYSSYMGFANSANDSLAYIGVDGTGLTNIVYGALTIGTWKDKPILFTTGTTNSEKMRIESNGNVGIGTTTAINNKLEVNGNINIPLGSTYKINNSDLAFSNLIGIVPPTSLPISGTGVSGNIGGVKVDGSSITITSSGIISASSASGSKWALSGIDNIYKVSGNVGIGTDTNIDEKLIVNGNIKITNGSLLTSNIITSNIITSNITTNIVNAQTISGAGSNITNINAGNIRSGTIDSLRLPIATSSVLGVVKKGNNINIDPNGVISADLLSYNGDSTINGNLVVNSNLIVHGTSTTLNTDVYTTERLEVTNSGTANSTLTIRQTSAGNTNNILNVINSSSTNVFNISSTGAVSTNNNNINAGTGTITAATFSGALSGNATTATNASGLIGTPNISVGTLTCSGDTNQITNTRDGGVRLTIKNNSSGSNAFTGLEILNAAGAPLAIFLNSSSRINDGGVNTATIRNDAGDLRLSAASNTPFIYLKSSNGNVGIGTTNPLKNLHILQTHTAGGTLDTVSTDITEADLIVSSMSSHTAKKDAGIMFFANGSTSANISYASGFIKSGWATAGSTSWNKGYIDFNTHSANNTTWTTDMRIQGGNIGIGTTNPTQLLTLNNGNILLTGLWNSSSKYNIHCFNTDKRLEFDYTNGTGLFDNNQITFNVNNLQAMNILTNGNVGIGKTAGYKLDVNGDVNATDIRVGGVSLNTTINTNNTNISNYVISTSNKLINTVQTEFYTKNQINTCNFIKSDAVTSNFWKNVNSTQNNTIYYGAPVKIGGSNTIDVGNNYILEVLGNVRIKGTITQGWIGDGSTSGDGGVLAPTIFGSGSEITSLNANNITLGTLPVTRGGTGLTTLTSGQLLIGNGTNPVTSFSGLTWTSGTNTLVATNITGAGFNITHLNANNISSGTIDGSRLPAATSSVLGGVKKGNNINIDPNGVISADLLSYNGDSTINGNLVVNSNLIVHGISTTLNTDVYTTERLEVTNSGTTNSTLTIRQTAAGNTNNIFNVINSATTNVFNVSSAGNVIIGETRSSTFDDNTSFVFPDSILYVRGSRTAGSTTNITFRGGLEGNNNGKVRLWLASDASHSSYIENEHIGSGNTDLMFGTSSGNTLPVERMRIVNNGNVGIGTNNPTARLHIHNTIANSDVGIRFTDSSSGATGSDGFSIGEDANQRAYLWNNENTNMVFATNSTERITIAANGAVGIQNTGYVIPNNYMTSGSLTIGNITTNYGGGSAFNTNTAGLLMECLDNTEIAIHDSGHSVHSFMRYTTNGNFTIGRNMGSGTANVSMPGSLAVTGTITAATFSGSGASLTSLTAANISGNINVAQGGTGLTTLTSGQLLIGNGTGALSQTANLTWTSGTNTLAATNITGAGSNITHLNAANISSGTIDSLRLPTATSSVLGGVKVDGTTITINSSTGVISGANMYVLPTATSSVLGGVKVDGTTITINSSTGVISGANTYVLPTATSSVLGGIKKGNNINIDPNGVISADLLSYNGDSTINGNLYVNSNLIVYGTSTTLHTDVYSTERLEVTNGGTANSTFTIKQTAAGNTNNIFNVINSATTNVFNVSSAGNVIIGSNVGIGITNPTSKLHIINSSTAGNADTGNISLYVYNPTNATNQKSIICNRIAGSASDKVIYSWDVSNSHGWSMYTSGNNTALRINSSWDTGGTDRITIQNNGNVGIGTNSALSSLHLHKNAITQDVRIILSDNTTTSSTSRGFQIIKGSDNIAYVYHYENQPMIFGTNAAERMRILANGNVGIGTTDPTTILDIVNASPIVQIRTTTGGLGKIQFGNSSHGIGRGPSVGTIVDGNDVSLWTAGTGSIAFATSSTERFRIASNGNISTNNNSINAGTGTITAATFSGSLSGNATTATNASGLTGTPNISVGSINSTSITNTGNWTWTQGANYLLNATANNQEWSFDLNNQNTYTGCYWHVWSDKTSTILACRGDTGFVGIGTNPSAYRLTVQGDIAASADVIAYYSDERLKDIKEYVKDVLPTLSKINVFKYNCNDLAASYGFDKSKNEIGLSAQEIKKYYPELVALAPFDTIRNEGSDINISKSGEDYLTLKYERFVPILLQGIKELKEENNLQQKEIKELKEENILQQKEIDDLKLRLTRLELLL